MKKKSCLLANLLPVCLFTYMKLSNDNWLFKFLEVFICHINNRTFVKVGWCNEVM